MLKINLELFIMIKKIKIVCFEVSVCVVWLTAVLGVLATGIKFFKEYTNMNGDCSNWVVAISTTLATLTAIVFGCFGERIREYFSEKANIVVSGFRKTRQQYVEIYANPPYTNKLNYCEVYRIMLKNESSRVAKDVVIDLVEVKDVNSGLRSIIPAPFQWTHLNSSFRNIAPNQEIFLDFIQSRQTFNMQHPTSFVVPLLAYNPNMINLTSQCTVKLKIYGENLEPKEILLEVFYGYNRGNFPSINIRTL